MEPAVKQAALEEPGGHDSRLFSVFDEGTIGMEMQEGMLYQLGHADVHALRLACRTGRTFVEACSRYLTLRLSGREEAAPAQVLARWPALLRRCRGVEELRIVVETDYLALHARGDPGDDVDEGPEEGGQGHGLIAALRQPPPSQEEQPPRASGRQAPQHHPPAVVCPPLSTLTLELVVSPPPMPQPADANQPPPPLPPNPEWLRSLSAPLASALATAFPALRKLSFEGRWNMLRYDTQACRFYQALAPLRLTSLRVPSLKGLQHITPLAPTLVRLTVGQEDSGEPGDAGADAPLTAPMAAALAGLGALRVLRCHGFRPRAASVTHLLRSGLPPALRRLQLYVPRGLRSIAGDHWLVLRAVAGDGATAGGSGAGTGGGWDDSDSDEDAVMADAGAGAAAAAAAAAAGADGAAAAAAGGSGSGGGGAQSGERLWDMEFSKDLEALESLALTLQPTPHRVRRLHVTCLFLLGPVGLREAAGAFVRGCRGPVTVDRMCYAADDQPGGEGRLAAAVAQARALLAPPARLGLYFMSDPEVLREQLRTLRDGGAPPLRALHLLASPAATPETVVQLLEDLGPAGLDVLTVYDCQGICTPAHVRDVAARLVAAPAPVRSLRTKLYVAALSTNPEDGAPPAPPGNEVHGMEEALADELAAAGVEARLKALNIKFGV